MAVSFDVSREDAQMIREIVKRAEALYKQANPRASFDRLSVSMDVTACHANGCPLRLADLLATDDFNLAHDVFGISRHINRDTGKLKGHFLPRFSA